MQKQQLTKLKAAYAKADKNPTQETVRGVLKVLVGEGSARPLSGLTEPNSYSRRAQSSLNYNHQIVPLTSHEFIKITTINNFINGANMCPTGHQAVLQEVKGWIDHYEQH